MGPRSGLVDTWGPRWETECHSAFYRIGGVPGLMSANYVHKNASWASVYQWDLHTPCWIAGRGPSHSRTETRNYGQMLPSPEWHNIPRQLIKDDRFPPQVSDRTVLSGSPSALRIMHQEPVGLARVDRPAAIQLRPSKFKD